MESDGVVVVGDWTTVEDWATVVDWSVLSKNAKLCDIVSNVELLWDWSVVSSRADLTIETVKLVPISKWDWRRLTMNSAIEYEEMFSNWGLPWNGVAFDARFVRRNGK